MKRENIWQYSVDAILHSYSQIFFSLDQLFAILILLVSFFNPVVGACGLAAVILLNAMAYIMGFNRKEIREGIFGFNALLFGLAMGFRYEINGVFLVLFFISILSLLVLTAVFQGMFSKKYLPFLSFPFIVCYWIVSLASSELTQIKPAIPTIQVEEGIPGTGHFFYTLVHSLDQFPMPDFLLIFFKTLAATFFISSVLGGVIIAIGLFYFSRITFTLAFLGFISAFYFYHLFGADTNQLSGNLVGSNYIFFAIAIGGFYLIPNVYSYGASIILIPVLMLLQIANEKLFAGIGLKTFTLAFSLLTTIFLFSLHQRWFHKFLHLVTIQYYSAEKTVYKYLNALSRFNHAHFKKIALPFWGNWTVSQGYDGKITHLGEWSKALDFVVTDGENKSYKEPGIHLGDFYCYNKPILAPADAYVYEIVNHIDDNEIGEVDTEKNWGNTIILNHLDGLYSQISHIKRDSFKVAVGDFVKKGTILASCGSSGRSPEPHLHFQLQHHPKVGSKTKEYPIAYFLEHHKDRSLKLKMFEVPEEGSLISNIEPLNLLSDAFDLAPGKKLRFIKSSSMEMIEWEVFTDAYNRLYVYENKTNSYAYFVNDGTRFYFTDFEGSRKSNLFHFYLSCYSVLLGAYPKLPLKDQMPLVHFNLPILIWLQDFLAPFYLFTEARYASQITYMDQVHSPEKIQLESEVHAYLFKQKFRSYAYQLQIGSNGLEEIALTGGKKSEKWTCVI